MATKTITITEDAYNYLKSLKGTQSFSETILGLRQSAADIMQFAGALKDADLTSLREARDRGNRSWADRRRHNATD